MSIFFNENVKFQEKVYKRKGYKIKMLQLKKKKSNNLSFMRFDVLLTFCFIFPFF